MNEFQKCKNDPVYFINTYVKLGNSEQSTKLCDYQEELIRQYQSNKFISYKGPRASGKTIVGLAYILHYMLFNDGMSIGIFSETDTYYKLNKLKELYRNLPEWLRRGVIKESNNLLLLGNYSLVMCGGYNSSSALGRSYDLIFIDKASSNNERFLNFWNMISPVVFSRKTTKMIVVSTENSKENDYHLVDSNDLAPVEVKIDLQLKQVNPVDKIKFTTSLVDKEPYGFYSHYLPSLVEKTNTTENSISFYDFVRSQKNNIPEKMSFYEFVRSKE